MLEKTIAALQAAEAAIQEEYEGVKGWHAQARGVLEEAYTAVTGWRQKLEGVEPPASTPEVATEAPPIAPTDGGESAPSTEEEAGAAAASAPAAVDETEVNDGA